MLLDLYDRALPQVYGYLLPRTGAEVVAEDLTAETFLAAVTAVQKGTVPDLTIAWLVGVARHKLVDHWRRQAREERQLRLIEQATVEWEDPWDIQLDVAQAHQTLAELGAHHRIALTLRYLDGLSVPEVADAARPNGPRHRGAARAGPDGLSPRLRGGERRCLTAPLDALR